MDSGINWEHKTGVLIDKLSEGIEDTKQLRAYLSSVASTCDGTQELLLHKILSSCEQSLSIVKGRQPLLPTAGAVESPVSANASPRTDDMNKRSFQDHQEITDSSKRRKSQPTKTTVRVSAVSCPNDDGCSWRKYGEKDILGAKQPSNNNQKLDEEMDFKRASWTVEEDVTLINHIAHHGEGCWNSLARSAGLKRTGKSCRLRWLNYLRPDVRRGNITLEEQLLILELHSRWGNRWSKIAQYLPGRTDNEIKNYWRTRVQKKPISPEKQANHPPTFSVPADRNQHLHLSRAKYDNLVIGGGSPSFDSPNSTAESSYFTASSCHMMNSSFGTVHSFQQSDSYRTDRGLVLNLYHSESDRTDIFSANSTATTSSSIMDDFPHPSLGATSKLPVC